jgi:hypothetical protein
VRSYVGPFLVLCLLVGCGGEVTPETDPVATQVAVMEAAAATLTAKAPTSTATVLPSATPTATALPTATSTATPIPTVIPTSTPLPSPTAPPPTATPAPPTTVPALPTATPAPPTATEPAPPVGPSLGRFAVVRVASNDVLNVRSGPGVAYPIVDTIPYHGLDVEVYAGAREVKGRWWVPVQYEDVPGWVNSNYLARQAGWVSEPVAARAAQIIMILEEGGLDALADRVHPDKGVRFSPYTYVRAVPGAPEGEDLVFTAAQIPGLASDPTVYHWGRFDGSGEPIDLTFAEYYDRFIYDAKFAAPDVVGFAETIGKGNTINNITGVYPLAVTIEYHFEGIDPQYAGLDWRSLRLVLEEKDGTWYLVGIVHDEWTI